MDYKKTTNIYQKQKLYKTHFINGTVADKNFFKKYSNKSTRVKKLGKKIYDSNQLEENKSNPKVIRKIIKSLLPSSTKQINKPSKINIDGQHVIDSEKICNYTNKFFVTVGKAFTNEIGDCTSNFKIFLRNKESQSMRIETTSAAQVYNIIQSMGINKASGYDNIDTCILHKTAEALSPILSNFFEHSSKFGKFPKILKTSEITPVYKHEMQK